MGLRRHGNNRKARRTRLKRVFLLPVPTRPIVPALPCGQFPPMPAAPAMPHPPHPPSAPPVPPLAVDTPKSRVMESHLPAAAKEFALRGHDAKTLAWRDRALALPLQKYSPPPSGELADALRTARAAMDTHICGNGFAKEEVLRVLGQWVTAGRTSTSAIGFEGPAGVGKTTFARNALSEALGRPFCFISLGGSSDGTLLTGHSFTYEGSMPGRIAQELTRAKCMDPVIYFDELDKVSQSARGDEIINALIHLTDPAQNSEFHDRYFHDVPLDLSRAILVFSFNDRSRINRILLDRLKVIACAAPSSSEKREIARVHLVPRALRNVGDEELASFEDAALDAMIASTDEAGVRELDRSIQHMINTLNVAVHGGELMGLAETPQRPVTCTAALCRRLLPPTKVVDAPPVAMYT